MEISGPKSIFSQASRPKKYLATCGLLYSCFSLGVANSFLNPTMVDFSKKLGESVDTVSLVFSVITGAYLFGAFFSGIVSHCIARPFVVMFLLTLMSVPLFALPHIQSVTLLYVLAAIIGFGGGGFDAAQCAWIIDIWRHDAPPFILTLHFAYSAGTLVPPLIQGPYLTEEEGSSSSTELPYESRLVMPFTIGGSIAFLAVIVQISMYIFLFRTNKKTSDGSMSIEIIEAVDNESKAETETTPAPSDSWKRKIMLIGFCCCVFGFYQGLELCTSQFISTFSTFSEVGLSGKESAKIAFGLQLGFASGRLCGILLVLKIAPHLLLAGNFTLLLVSNVILVVWAGSNVIWLRVGSVMMGLGMSTVYGALYAFIEKYIFISDGITSTVAVAGGFISAIYPVVVGKSVEKNPRVMTYVNFVSIFVCAVAFSILFLVTHVRASRMGRRGDEKTNIVESNLDYSTFS